MQMANSVTSAKIGFVSESFVKDSASVLFTRVITFVIGLVGGIIIARVLGPTNKGTLAIITLVPMLLVVIGNLGIGQANLYFIGKKKASIKSIISNSLTISICLGGILLIVYFLIVWILKGSIFKDVNTIFIILSAGTIPFLLFINYSTHILLGKQMIAERNKAIILKNIVNVVFIILFVLILRFGINGVLIAILGELLGITFLCLHYLKQMTNLRLNFDWLLFKKSIKYGINPYLTLIVLSLNYKFDLFLIKYFLGSTAVGYYSLSASIADKLIFLPSAVGLVVFSRVASLDDNQANILTPSVCRNSLFLSLLGSVILFFAGRFFIPLLYGNAFFPSVNPLMILLPGMVALTVLQILHGDLAGRGRPEITLYVFSCALALNIILNIILIPIFGINGAALASTISYITGSFILSCLYSKKTDVKLQRILVPERDDFKNYYVIFFKLLKKK